MIVILNLRQIINLNVDKSTTRAFRKKSWSSKTTQIEGYIIHNALTVQSVVDQFPGPYEVSTFGHNVRRALLIFAGLKIALKLKLKPENDSLSR